MELFKDLRDATPRTKRELQEFGRLVSKKVGMDVVIDGGFNANDISTEWFGFEKEQTNGKTTVVQNSQSFAVGETEIKNRMPCPIIFNTKALEEKVKNWNISSQVKNDECKMTKAFAIAFYLSNNKEAGNFVKRHFKVIRFADKMPYDSINIDNFKIAVDGKVLKIEQKVFDSNYELARYCDTIIKYLRENVGFRASVRKRFGRKS